MDNLNAAFVDKIVESCFNFYSKTPKSGKPLKDEWTILSCVVKYSKENQIEVVSLGTGSKCVGASKMSPKGDVLNDSHAEVFARRGFLIYLYDNITKSLENQPSIFDFWEGRFQLKNDINFAFYSSQLPCGDASIFPKSDDELVGDVILSKKHKIDDIDIPSKKPKLQDDIHRTGAKCLPDSEQDSKESGKKYHTLGLVRTKPGRGDRTLSVSCSDKIARWIHCGIQGSLLTLLCEPIYIKHYIFGAGVPYSEESLHRALLNRGYGSDLKLCYVPKFHQCRLQFENRRTDNTVRPAAGSIVWIKLNNPLTEVAVQGKKLGVTKKKASSPINSLCISKYNIYKRFVDVLNSNEEIRSSILKDPASSVPYNVVKKKAVRYMKQWLEVKEKFFKIWTVKPDMWDFCVENE